MILTSLSKNRLGISKCNHLHLSWTEIVAIQIKARLHLHAKRFYKRAMSFTCESLKSSSYSCCECSGQDDPLGWPSHHGKYKVSIITNALPISGKRRVHVLLFKRVNKDSAVYFTLGNNLQTETISNISSTLRCYG